MCSWGTCSLQHLLSILSSPAFHLSSLSLCLSLSSSLSFQGAYRCLILDIKNSPQFLIVEYFMPFNFSHALKVTLPSLPFISPFSQHSVEAYQLFLQHRSHCRRTPYHHGINCPEHFPCVTTWQNNNTLPPTCSDCTVCPLKWTASTKQFMNLNECFALLWHLWLPLWSFNSKKCQREIPQWREWTEEVQYAWVCQGHVFIMTRITSRREAVWNINTQEMTQRRGKHLHSDTSLPQKEKKVSNVFENAIKLWAWLN